LRPSEAVVDIARDMMVLMAELHADEEALLIAARFGSNRSLGHQSVIQGWKGMISWNSIRILISALRGGTRSRGVEDPAIRERIRRIVNNLVIR